MHISTKFVVSLLVAATATSAKLLHVYPGDMEARDLHEPAYEHMGRRHMALSRRASATNAAEYAAITDTAQECTPYGNNEVTQMQNAKDFPTASQIASIVSGDDTANSVWSDIQKSGIIPSNVNVKPQQGADNMGIDLSSYDTANDPDCWWSAKQCKQPKHSNLVPDLFECPEPDTWGLTFDDGPNCTHNAFYNFLSQNKLKATMFFIGSNVVNWPLQAQRAIVDGHDVCVHTWSHRYMTTLTNDQVFAELYYTAKVIKQITGVTPTCWRPPYGDTDDRVRSIAYGLGLRTILWEEDTDDWNIMPAGSMATSQIDQNYEDIISKSGSESPIVLTHEINQQTMDEFQKMYPKLKNAYKNVVPLTACQNVSQPYPDSNIQYPGYTDFVAGKVNASNLPTGTSIAANQSATYSPTALNNTKVGYGHPSSSSSSSGSGSSSKKDSTSHATSLSSIQAAVMALGGAVAFGSVNFM
ncbi:hypothetical protein MYAM1_002770 [Malassezia yamatoensis]|uniref:chitin deacetylase n=1 Tax=Malassezia yamatoensis TaxID=253288 RepID=A0AAJ5YSR0_9BASI|nr:hypothetical protein MYAM1_002770 [Malassezia yamatoensis]